MWFLSAVSCILLSIISERGVISDCTMTDTECVFYLNVEHKLTMMKGTAAVFPGGGKLYKYDVTNRTSAIPEDAEGVVQGDGFETQRLVTVANGTMPGPSIEVFEGQTVIVHVTSSLYSEGMTMHWHGLHQKGTPFMDGVAFITQCPILPGQTFTYKFKAEPKGTFWYHAHVPVQRTMGLFGAFIIHEEKKELMKEHIVQLQDWNHDDSITVHLKMNVGGFVNRHPQSTTDNLDGSHFSRFFMLSGLINGRGRLYDTNGEHNGAPLSIFEVSRDQSYRFRVISAGHLYPYRVSVDGHELTIVASDAFDLQHQSAESFIINPGERIDFILNATQPVANYWVRAQTLETGVDHKAEAILRYDGATEEEPTSLRRPCTSGNQCNVINCPFEYYPIPNTRCLRFDQLRSLAVDPPPVIHSGKFKEHFLNFAFPGITHHPGQVNGHAFKIPTVNTLTQIDEVDTLCKDTDCGEDKTCYCSYNLELKYNDTVQLVFINMGVGKGWNHPIHFHGHSFYVLKMGYAVQNESNGQIVGDNLDIDCGNTEFNFCNNAKWANKSWTGDAIPGLELTNPPRKDTIIVPTGGYVVTRIRADNPGVWFMHCHIEMHNTDGMAMMVTEGIDHLPKQPLKFPTCSEFGPEVTFEEPSTTGEKGSIEKTGGIYDYKFFWIIVGSLIGLCALEFIIISCMCCRRCEGSGREKYRLEEDAPREENKGYQKY